MRSLFPQHRGVDRQPRQDAPWRSLALSVMRRACWLPGSWVRRRVQPSRRSFLETTILQARGSQMGVSKNSGTPKWILFIMENPIKMDDLGGNPPLFSETSKWRIWEDVFFLALFLLTPKTLFFKLYPTFFNPQNLFFLPQFGSFCWFFVGGVSYKLGKVLATKSCQLVTPNCGETVRESTPQTQPNHEGVGIRWKWSGESITFSRWTWLGGGSKYFLFSPLLGDVSHFD